MKEVRLHGVGGQGTVTIGGLIVYCLALEGKHACSIPAFGPERRGMPVIATVRFDDKPIRQKDLIYEPHCVVIQDGNLVRMVPVFEGLRGDGIVVINETCTPEEMGLPPSVKKVGIVDATAIALEAMGVPITNTTVLGAFAATTGFATLESVLKSVETTWKGELLEKNKRAARMGYEQCQVYNVGE